MAGCQGSTGVTAQRARSTSQVGRLSVKTRETCGVAEVVCPQVVGGGTSLTGRQGGTGVTAQRAGGASQVRRLRIETIETGRITKIIRSQVETIRTGSAGSA